MNLSNPYKEYMIAGVPFGVEEDEGTDSHLPHNFSVNCEAGNEIRKFLLQKIYDLVCSTLAPSKVHDRTKYGKDAIPEMLVKEFVPGEQQITWEKMDAIFSTLSEHYPDLAAVTAAMKGDKTRAIYLSEQAGLKYVQRTVSAIVGAGNKEEAVNIIAGMLREAVTKKGSGKAFFVDSSKPELNAELKEIATSLYDSILDVQLNIEAKSLSSDGMSA